MIKIGSRWWLEVNYGDLSAIRAKRLLSEKGYDHSFLRRLHVSNLMKLTQEKIGNLIPCNGLVGTTFEGHGDIYLTIHDFEKINQTTDSAKRVADGWWALPHKDRMYPPD